MTLSIAMRGCSVSPGRGIMSTILTLNYSNSGCSCCLRTMLRIKHKDQAGIRRKPLTSAAPPLCCGSTRAHTAPPKSHAKLLPASQHATRRTYSRLIWISKAKLIANKIIETQRVKAAACVRVCEHVCKGFVRADLFWGLEDGRRRFLPDAGDSHVLLTGNSCALAPPCNRAFIFFFLAVKHK